MAGTAVATPRARQPEQGRRRSLRAPRQGLPAVFPPLLVAAIAVNLYGIPYYLLPIAQRVRHPLHEWLKPSGTIGQAAGVVTFLLFAFLWLYPLRKRVPWLGFTGSLSRWLDYHIAAGLLMPVVGAIHAAWRFDGLIGLGYDAMLVVCASGAVGKYLYTRIPHARGGAELSLEQMGEERSRLLSDLSRVTGFEMSTLAAMLTPSVEQGGGSRSMLRSLVAMVGDDLARRRTVRGFVREWRRVAGKSGAIDTKMLRRAARLARRELALHQQMKMLDATHRVFRFWHAAHLPVAISAFLAVLIHVVLVVALGSTWFW